MPLSDPFVGPSIAAFSARCRCGLAFCERHRAAESHEPGTRAMGSAHRFGFRVGGGASKGWVNDGRKFQGILVHFGWIVLRLYLASAWEMRLGGSWEE